MVRESEKYINGRTGFDAHVKYEIDDHEQWELIGDPVFCHEIVTEPSQKWLRTGSEFIGAKCYINEHVSAEVMFWLPKDPNDPEEFDLFKVYHDDGDYEDLDVDELKKAIELFEENELQCIECADPSEADFS